MATKRTKKNEADLPTVRRCGTDEVHYRLLLDVPEYATRRAAIENQAFRAALIPEFGRTGCTRIPVVVHVVHRTSAENISSAQIDSQIAVLNDDFRRRNGDVSSVPAAFSPLAADSRVEFALATTDPSGNPTDGITRTSTSVNGFGTNDAVKSASTGGSDPWPTDQYLNIWVCRLAGGLLGYAQFPGGPSDTDGVAITYTGFGTTGTAAPPFNLGRTATHEIGHWLNLRHIWGDDAGGCSGSDFVADTPNQGGPNYGTPTFPTISCGNGPNGDMFMNYMDYVDDASMVMFTTGQTTRMHAALDGPRSSIGAAIPCVPGPKLKFADDPGPKLKFADDPGPKLKFRDDPGPKLKFRDDPPKNKFRDDPGPKFKFRDDPPKNKFRDDPGPKNPAGDLPPVGSLPGPLPPRGAAPFVLATPHHSQAWQQSYPEAAEATLAEYEAQLAQMENLLEQFQAAEQGGELGPGEQEAYAQLSNEYAMLAEEYRQMRGG